MCRQQKESNRFRLMPREQMRNALAPVDYLIFPHHENEIAQRVRSWQGAGEILAHNGLMQAARNRQIVRADTKAAYGA